MELYGVVLKLVGPTFPIGETNEDERRFENLKELTKLVDLLLRDIDQIATLNVDRVEFSMKRSGQYCHEFMDRIGISNDP